MKVTLINPPRFSISANPFRSGGYLPNLGLLYVAAALEKKGIEVCLCDAVNDGFTHKEEVTIGDQMLFRYGLPYEKICESIDNDTDFIGIAIPFSNSAQIVKELALLLKENFPQVPIIVGGVHASTQPEEALSEGVDYVIVGEGEDVFVKLVEKSTPSDLPGVAFRQGGQLIIQDRAPYVSDLDSLAYPAHHLLDLDKILSLSPRGERQQRSISLITSRGCPFDCEFCSVHAVHGYKWRSRSPESVLQEISYYQENYQVNHIEFEDDNLTYVPERAEEIFAGLKAFKKPLSWSAHNGVRIDKLTYNLLKLMKESGCTRLNLAVESGCDRTLDLMRKKLSLAKVEEVVTLCAELQIPTTGFMLIGYPGETPESFQESIAFFRRLLKMGLSEVAPFIVNPYQGTKLFEKCKNNGHLQPDAATHIYTIDDPYVGIITPDFSEADVLAWYEEASNLTKPVRWQLKRLLHSMLGESIYQKTLRTYRKMRGFT